MSGKLNIDRSLKRMARKHVTEAREALKNLRATPTSDAAELLEKSEEPWLNKGFKSPWKQTDIVCGFHYRVDGGRLQLQFSTRSHTGYDVGAFCKSRGGGGHSAAAGFTVEQSAEVGANPYSVFRLLLEEWEQGQ